MLGRKGLLLLAAVLAPGCASGSGTKQEPAPDVVTAKAALPAAASLGDLGAAAAGEWAGRARVVGKGQTARQRLQESFDQAKALHDEGRHERAAQAFEAVYTYSPRSETAEEGLYWAGEAWLAAGEAERALELSEKFLREYPASPHYPDVLVRIFKVGQAFTEAKVKKTSWFLGVRTTDVEFGIEILERFVKQRDRHPLSPEALFLVGEAHVRRDEPELAIESWQRLMKEYPQSPFARLAEYRIALAFLSLSYGIEYDKRPILTALRRLRSYVRKYPTGDNINEAQERLTKLEEQLARHDLSIAKRYARDDQYVAAQIYLNAIRREYPKTDAAKEAERLGKVWPDPVPPPAADDSP